MRTDVGLPGCEKSCSSMSLCFSSIAPVWPSGKSFITGVFPDLMDCCRTIYQLSFNIHRQLINFCWRLERAITHTTGSEEHGALCHWLPNFCKFKFNGFGDEFMCEWNVTLNLATRELSPPPRRLCLCPCRLDRWIVWTEHGPKGILKIFTLI